MAKQERAGREQYPEYYTAWLAMNRRCYNEKHRDYKDYGAKGVKVCPQWHIDNEKGYLNYVNWIIEQPNHERLLKGWVVSRVKTNGDYTPENCDIVTRQESTQRRRTTSFRPELVVEARRLVRQDPSITLKILCDRYGFGTEACWSRMLSGKGWDNIDAIEPPITNIWELRRQNKVTASRPRTCQ
jgi:hypothetical protein